MRLGRLLAGMLQKVDDDLGDVFRLDLPVGAIGAAPAAESGRDRARHHAADPDVVVAHLLHQRFRERVETGLRGAVGRAAGKRILSRQAADVDDPAAAPLPQVRDGRVAVVEDAAEVRVDHRLPVGDRHLRGILQQGDPGVVHEHVEAAETIDRLAHGRTDLSWIPDIGDDGEGARNPVPPGPVRGPRDVVR